MLISFPYVPLNYLSIVNMTILLEWNSRFLLWWLCIKPCYKWRHFQLTIICIPQTKILGQRALAIKFCGVNDGFQWALANVYGPNVEAERSEFLDLLANFISQWHAPWVFRGDFNMVRYPHEKRGKFHHRDYGFVPGLHQCQWFGWLTSSREKIHFD